MERTRRIRKFVVVGAALAIVGATVPMAHAQLTSTDSGDLVTASVVSQLTMAAPGDIAFGALNVDGTANTQTGTLDVSSNVPYTVTLASDRDSMTVHDGTAYTAQELLSPLSVAPVISTGVGAGSATTSTLTGDGTAETVATSAGLADDSYTVTYSQPATFADQVGDYRMILTYTATETL